MTCVSGDRPRYWEQPLPLFAYHYITIWSNLKARSKYLVIKNLSWPFICECTTTTHISIHNVLFINFVNNGLIGTNKELQRHVLLHIITAWYNLVPCLSRPTMSSLLYEPKIWILQRVDIKFLPRYVDLFLGMYSPLYAATITNWCV